jgi:hypothetical protein
MECNSNRVEPLVNYEPKVKQVVFIVKPDWNTSLGLKQEGEGGVSAPKSLKITYFTF